MVLYSPIHTATFLEVVSATQHNLYVKTAYEKIRHRSQSGRPFAKQKQHGHTETRELVRLATQTDCVCARTTL